MAADWRSSTAGVDTYLYHRLGYKRPQARTAGVEVESFGAGGAPPAAAEPAGKLPALLRLRDPDKRPDLGGVEVHSQMGPILTVRVTAEGLAALRDWPNTGSIEASREGGGNDVAESLPFVRADVVHRPPLDERGSEALFGLIDSGVDVLHRAFMVGSPPVTRLVALWDQTDPAGPTPRALNPQVYPQDYGTLHLPNTINQWIGSDQVPRPSLRDPETHGTHVASIAAGSPLPPSFPGGLAPEAPMVVVVPAFATEAGDPLSLGYSNSHVDGLDFIRRTANDRGMPVVVNVSLGMNAGAHDGSSLLESAFDAFSGGGRDPGLVIVKSAGNERGHGGRAEARVFEGGLTSIEWVSNYPFRPEDYIECWYASSDELAFTIVDPAGNHMGPVSDAQPMVAGTLGGNAVGLSLTRFHHDNGDSRLVITIRGEAGPIQPGTWRLDVGGLRVASDGLINAWVERDRARSVRFQSGNVHEMTLSIPGTAHSVVTVGACESSDPMRLASRSSWGPTRDGRRKPDIVAPGVNIQAARAGGVNHDELVAMTGTSMAAPHVSGALALLLSYRERRGLDQLNVAQIRAGLAQVSAHYTGRWHEGFGYGRLDVEALLELFRG